MKTFLTLYESLLDNGQVLDRQQAEYFKKRVKSSLSELFGKDALSEAQREQFATLSKRDAEQQEAWRFYDEFIQFAPPTLTNRLIRLTDATFYHLAWENTFLSLTTLSDDAKRPVSLLFGFQFDWTLLRTALEDKIKSLYEATNLPIALLSNQERPIVFASLPANQNSDAPRTWVEGKRLRGRCRRLPPDRNAPGWKKASENSNSIRKT